MGVFDLSLAGTEKSLLDESTEVPNFNQEILYRRKTEIAAEVYTDDSTTGAPSGSTKVFV